MDEDLRIQVVARRGREVRKKVFHRYLPRHKSLSNFFDDLAECFEHLLDDLIKTRRR